SAPPVFYTLSLPDALPILQASGIRVYTWRWPTALEISTAGDLLRVELESNAQLSPEVVLVGHSFGGLVSLRALTSGGTTLDKVVRVVTLGTPHLGTNAAFFPLWSKAAVEAQPGTQFINDLQLARSVLMTDPITYVLGGRFLDMTCFDAGFPYLIAPDPIGDCV